MWLVKTFNIIINFNKKKLIIFFYFYLDYIMFDIDTLSDAMVEIYFQWIYKEMETNPDAPYEFEVTTRPEWIKWLDERKQTLKKN